MSTPEHHEDDVPTGFADAEAKRLEAAARRRRILTIVQAACVLGLKHEQAVIVFQDGDRRDVCVVVTLTPEVTKYFDAQRRALDELLSMGQTRETVLIEEGKQTSVDVPTKEGK